MLGKKEVDRKLEGDKNRGMGVMGQGWRVRDGGKGREKGRGWWMREGDGDE